MNLSQKLSGQHCWRADGVFASLDLNQGEPRVAQNDEGFDQFMTMIDQQDMNGLVPEGLLTLMANLATSCSTSNLFQAS